MRVRWHWLKSMRGRILVWYVGVLGAVLLGYCAFQTMTLSAYFRSTTAFMMQQTAAAELATVGPCYVRSPVDLKRSAIPLAWLLGSQNGTATIVTTTGTILASHSAGAAGPPPPSAALIQQLIPNPKSVAAVESEPVGLPACRPVAVAPRRFAVQHASSPPAVRRGDILRTAILLGPAAHPVG